MSEELFETFKDTGPDLTGLNVPIYPKSYHPGPPIPRWFKRTLLLKGGRNEHGEANFRVVWGMDARDERGRIKYMNPHDWALGWACFVLERWATPTFFDENLWNELRYGNEYLGTDGYDLLGEFPRHGRYICVGPLATEKNGKPYEALPLSSQVLDSICAQIGRGELTTPEAIAMLHTKKERERKASQHRLREAQETHREEFQRKKQQMAIIGSRGTVTPSIGLPIKTVLDETRKLFVPERKHQ